MCRDINSKKCLASVQIHFFIKHHHVSVAYNTTYDDVKNGDLMNSRVAQTENNCTVQHATSELNSTQLNFIVTYLQLNS